MSIRSFWARAGRPTRALVVTLLALGVCSLSLGLISDQYGWWTTRPFLTNLASGMTSACFGVPFALLILSSLTSIEDSNVQRRNVENLLEGALEWLEDWVHRVTSSRFSDRVDAGLDPVTRSAIVASNTLGALLPWRADNPDTLPAARHAMLACRDTLTELQDYLQSNFSFQVDIWKNTGRTPAPSGGSSTTTSNLGSTSSAWIGCDRTPPRGSTPCCATARIRCSR